MAKVKISLRVHTELFSKFTDEVTSLSLKRDEMLERLIVREMPELRKELNGKKLSKKAATHISTALKGMNVKTVSIALSSETAKFLKEICNETGVLKDPFINRLILFFLSEDPLLNTLEIEKDIYNSGQSAPFSISPLKALQEAMYDPFHYLRTQCEEKYSAFYLIRIPKLNTSEYYDGFSCFIEEQDTQSFDELEQFLL